MALNAISNYAANVAHRNLQTSDAQATSSLAKLSSGSRVVSARDDAASMAIGSRLNAQVMALRQASVNAGQGVSMLQIADGAMAKANDVLVRMKILAVQAGSGQLSGTERSMLNSEYQLLLEEVTRIAASTEFNGNQLVNGSLTTNLAQVSVPATTLASTTNFSLGTTATGTVSGTVGAFAADTSGNITVTIGTDNFTASVTPVTTSTGLLADTTDFLLSAVGGSVQGTRSASTMSNGTATIQIGGVGFTANIGTSGDTNNDVVAGNAYTFSDGSGGSFVLVARTNYDLDAANTFTTDLNAALGTNAFLTSSDLDSNSTLSFSNGSGNTFELTLNGSTQYDLNLAGTGSLTQGTTTLYGRGLLTDNLDAAFLGVTYGTTLSAAAGPFGADNGVTSITGRGLTAATTANYTLSYGGTTDYTFTLTDGTNNYSAAIDAGVVDANGSMLTGTSLKLTSTTADGELIIALNTSFQSDTAVAASAANGGMYFTGADTTTFTFKVGTGTDATKDSIDVTIDGVNATNLGLVGSDITTVATADAASDLITLGIDSLNTARARIGAFQNRLDFAAANIATAVENTEAARSNLLDLDMASEMTVFTSKQILVQAGVAMLAQANQMPQNLLRLFQ